MLSSTSLRRLLLAGAGCALLIPVVADAQAVDYGSLEQVFGEPITTSVTGKPQRASEVPGDLTIITQDDIRRSGAPDIPGILQFVTGIDTRRYTFGDNQVAIRGYDTPLNPRLLVLVDGRQVYLDDEGYVAWNAIPVQLDEIRQIEVVKGPASALFGFNAASGVINIVTFDPLLDKIKTATIRGGTQGLGQGDAVATQHFGTTAGVRLSVGGWTATGFDQPNDDSSQASPRYASVNISGRWQVTPTILLRAEGGDLYTHTRRFLPDGSGTPTNNAVNFWRVGGAATTKIGTIDLDVYRNQALDEYSSGTSNNKDYIVKLSDLAKLDPANTIRLGFDYRSNAISGSIYSGTISYQNFAAQAMWDWQISPMFDLTNAVRLDHLELHFAGNLPDIPNRTIANYDNATITQPSFNSGLVIQATEKDTVRLTLARGLQVPSLINFGFNLHAGPVELLGSPNVRPVAVWNAELAYDRALATIGAKWTTSVYFQRNTDLISSPGTTPFSFVNGVVVNEASNIGSSNEVGFETELRGKTPGGFRWNVSYRHAEITQDLTAAAVSDTNSNTSYDNGTPKHTVIIGAGYSIQKWEFDGAGRWQSKFTDYVASDTPSAKLVSDYFTLHARIGYDVTKYLTIAGTADQFNEAHIFESAGGYVDRQFIASATIKF